jgi:hypothetical protein
MLASCEAVVRIDEGGCLATILGTGFLSVKPKTSADASMWRQLVATSAPAGAPSERDSSHENGKIFELLAANPIVGSK